MSPITKATKSYPSLFTKSKAHNYLYQAPHHLLITKPKAHNYIYQAPHYLLITKPQLGNVNQKQGFRIIALPSWGLVKRKEPAHLVYFFY